jgi:hypothetical protein
MDKGSPPRPRGHAHGKLSAATMVSAGRAPRSACACVKGAVNVDYLLMDVLGLTGGTVTARPARVQQPGDRLGARHHGQHVGEPPDQRQGGGRTWWS